MTEGGENSQGACDWCGADPADCKLACEIAQRNRDLAVRAMNLVRLYINDESGLGKVYALKRLQALGKEMDEHFPGWRDEDV